jgi:tellurite resistance protein TerA
MTKKPPSSGDSIREATRWRASASGHGGAKGAAGVRESSFDPENCDELSNPGQNIAVNVGLEGFGEIMIGAEWDNVHVEQAGFFGKLLNKATKKGVDLDIGCLYELHDGTRGTLQAFGEKFGSFDAPPYISLSEDERTGDAEGFDEKLLINGAHWDKIKRVLVYIYIYGGAPNWSLIKPRVFIDVPGENDLMVTLKHHNDALDICAVGGLENIRGSIKLTNYTEYFPGHPSMDRAFGYGLEWEDGEKRET